MRVLDENEYQFQVHRNGPRLTRRPLFWTHLGAGCLAGAILLVLSATGLLLAFERQIVDWADGELPSAPAEGSRRIGAEALLAAARAREAETPTSLTLRSDPTAPAAVGFGRERTILLDPRTGGVLGEASPGVRRFFRAVESCHRFLGMGGEARVLGRAVTGASTLLLVGLVLSGSCLWWPRKGGAGALVFRSGLRGRARDFDWHNVVGFWSALPLLVIALTGVVMSYPWANALLFRMAGDEPPQARPPDRAGRRGSAYGAQPAPFDGIDPLWARAEGQVPAWRSITLRVPATADAAVAFSIDTGNGGRPDTKAQLTLDRRTGEMVRFEPFTATPLGRRLRAWVRFSHTGEAGGVAGQTVAAVASGGATILVWTGLSLALRRSTAWARRKEGERS
jgi:uncharacterized iron-regulated membrane protein